MSPFPMTGPPSAWVTNLRSVLVGFGFFFLGSISDVWLQQHARSHSVAIITDAALGIAAGLLVLLYERRQGQNIIRKLETIRLMNHHVRNSLQVIAFATSAPQQEELTVDVRDAVERIEWALREVLPGQRKDDKTGFSFALIKPERGGSGSTRTEQLAKAIAPAADQIPGRQPQCCGGAVDHMPRAFTQQLVTADAIVRT